MKKQLLFLLFILFLQNINSQAFQDTIPFRNDLGLIIIPMIFNGEEKQLAFDTGAQYTVSYSWAEKSLKKTRRVITINSSSGLKSKMRFYKSGKVELGSRKISGHKILNAPENDIFSCYKVDGILGVDIIKEFNWVIDYKNQILIMYPSNYTTENVKEMHQLDFIFSNNRPYVFLKHKKNKFRFLLDTGAGGFSNISKRNYNLTGLKDLPQVDMYTGSFDFNGILTSSQPKIFQLSETTSKQVKLSPVVYYNNQKSSKIGNKLWKKQQLFLSLKQQELHVSSSRIIDEFQSFPCSVIFHKGKMRIMKIVKGSDIWNMGLRQGDEVALYDGKKFNDFCSLNQYQRKELKDRKSIDLQLPNGKTVTIFKTTSLK